MKREISVLDVFRHYRWTRQRRVLDIIWDDIYYHDWIWHWYCSKQHFFSVCPKEVVIDSKLMKIAKHMALWKYEIYEKTKNWVYVE